MSTFRFDELTIDCFSRAGDETWFRVRPPGLAIDCGRGSPRLRDAEPIFLTHGHLDHSLGVASLLSVSSQQGSGAPVRIVCPAEILPRLDAMLAAAADLDGNPFDYALQPIEPGERLEVGRGLWMEAFACQHVVPTVGYHLIRERRRLKSSLAGLPAEEIVERRKSGEDVEEVVEHLWLSCTGDTTARVFAEVPQLFDSEILITECTFLGPEERQRAARFGHTHLDDLAELRHRFGNRFLVLSHLSRRHRAEDLRRAVEERLEPLAPQVLIVGERRPEGDNESR